LISLSLPAGLEMRMPLPCIPLQGFSRALLFLADIIFPRFPLSLPSRPAENIPAHCGRLCKINNPHCRFRFSFRFASRVTYLSHFYCGHLVTSARFYVYLKSRSRFYLPSIFERDACETRSPRNGRSLKQGDDCGKNNDATGSSEYASSEYERNY